MESGAWKLMSMAYYIITFIVWFAVESTAGGSVCLVTPSAVAVIAGDNVSLTCTATTDPPVISYWKRGSDYSSSSIVFQAPADYGRNNSVPRIVVDGYLVDDLLNGQVILIVNNASTVQADRYYCSCYQSSSAANVIVLVSKPTFSTTSQITDGRPVNITCSVSFNGTADASLTITDISGTKVAEKNEGGTYPSNSTDLHVISVDYNTTAKSSVNQTYSCQISLTQNSVSIYSEPMVTSVQWVPVRNVQIIPVETNRCSNNSQCAINQTLNCSAEGNPYPVLFQWTAFLNGSIFKNTSGQLFTLASTGNYKVQCTTFNSIGANTYSNTSEYFMTEVTVDGPPTPLPDTQNNDSTRTAIIAGVVVGVGGAIIIVTIIVVFLLCKRKKSHTVCCNPDDKETRSNQGVELSKHHNGNNSFNTDNGVQNKSFVNGGNDDVTLVENDLYSGKQSKTQIDPSDGGYASVNEVMQQSK